MSVDLGKWEALRAERDRYVAMAFCCADLLFELNREAEIVYVAGPTQAFVGHSAEALRGTLFRDLVAPVDAPLVAQLLSQILQVGRVHDEPIRLQAPNGHQLWTTLSAYCLDGRQGKLYLGLRKGRSPCEPSACPPQKRDQESGLFEGGSFAELAADRLKKIQAAGENAELTLVSIPSMQALRERLDDKANESLMSSVGNVLKANSVGGDAAAKVGEGRFSLMHAMGANIEQIIQQIQDLTQQADPTGQGVTVESATVALQPDDAITSEDLAKGLLYTLTKFRDGEDNIRLQDLTANMSQLVGEAVAEVNTFRQIVSQSEFFVALQPVIHINNGEIHHYEALCRFERNAEQSPFKVITFAEETGLIHEFDLAMARKVIEWLGKYPRNSYKYRVAVNVSGFSIGKPAYVDSLLQLLKANAWTQGKLMFEITESSRMQDLEAANNFIQALRSRGYGVCLDDFGAGAASFQYLSTLEVDVVKLDGSAIRNAQRAAKGRAFLSALTELCCRMNVETVAEMVDSTESLEFCRDCGCDYVQGYLFGKPSREVRDFIPLPNDKLFRKLANKF